MNVATRLDRLEQAVAEPPRTVFFWREGDGLTPEQKVQVAKAEARGDKVMIFGWNDRAGSPPDLNKAIENASDDELRSTISAAVGSEV